MSKDSDKYCNFQKAFLATVSAHFVLMKSFSKEQSLKEIDRTLEEIEILIKEGEILEECEILIKESKLII